MVRFPRRGAIAVVLLVGLARSAVADDDTSLAQARRDVEASDYMSARSALVAALNGGGSTPEDLAEIYKLSGVVEGALGNVDAATAAFEKWIALDPKASLPQGTSPKIMRPFDAAGAKVKRMAPLKVKTETSANPPWIAVVVASDPLGLVARARVHVIADGKAEQTLEGAGKRRIPIDLPHGKRLDVRVEVLDVHGNSVAALGSADVPIVITDAEPHDRTPPPDTHVAADVHAQATPEPGNPRPIYLNHWAWAGVAIAAAGGASYFGFEGRSASNDLQALNANSSAHNFSEAQAVESRARRDLLVFNIGMGVAGVFAVGATVLYLTAPHVTKETRVSAMPTPGGAAVVLGGQF